MPSRVLLVVTLLAVPALAQTPPPPLDVAQGNQRVHDVAKTGTPSALQQLLAKEPAQLNVKNVRGATPLHLAAINPDPGVVEALLRAGAEVNVADDEGYTPLHMAAFHRQADSALLLLEAGANVNAVSTSGRTPLSMAEKARADEVSGVISLWILKGCKPRSGCGVGTPRAVKKLVK
ncbi:MAG: ankyrin repeat domain-containing protein [Myxococcus sp.]|nr:ankyrin repeat domain-containing protein [Myxococcus sp.]